jgi:hypothetical protein
VLFKKDDSWIVVEITSLERVARYNLDVSSYSYYGVHVHWAYSLTFLFI